MIRITLHGQPGAYTGTIHAGTDTWAIASWQRGADGGQVIARTDDGTLVTLALGPNDSGLAIGGRRWTLRNVRWAGLTMTADSIEAPSDEWLEGYIERMARRVRG